MESCVVFIRPKDCTVKMSADFIFIFPILRFLGWEQGMKGSISRPTAFTDKLYRNTSFRNAYFGFRHSDIDRLPYPVSVCWRKILTLNVWFHVSKVKTPMNRGNNTQDSAELFGPLYHFWGDNFQEDCSYHVRKGLLPVALAGVWEELFSKHLTHPSLQSLSPSGCSSRSTLYLHHVPARGSFPLYHLASFLGPLLAASM